MTHITATPRAAIPLGRLGENEHTQIEFNVEQWQTEYPGCHFTLQNRRPEDETAYPVADVTLDGSTLRWTVASSALTQTGRGECELCVMLGDVVAKSIIYATIIGRALDGSGDVPDEWENWQTVFMSIKDDAETAADNAEEAEAGADAARQAIEDMGVEADTLESGSDATVVKTTNPETGAVTLTFGIPKGDKGDTGPTGADGFSPIASVSKQGNTATITVTDKNGTTTATISDGETGATGPQGAPGQDGFSPSATVTQTATGATISITDAQGTTTADITNGQNGAPGQDGVSPEIAVTDITGGHRVTITDAQGTETFDVMDGADGQDGAPGVGVPAGGTAGQVLSKASGADYDTEWATPSGGDVTDVQVNGTSVVTGGVANVPWATQSSPGVVVVNPVYGMYMTNGHIVISQADANMVKAGSWPYKTITPAIQHSAAFYGLAKAAGDTTQSQSSNAVGQYTEAAKSAIHEMLNGAVTVEGTTPTITALPGVRYVCGECATLDITLPASGCIDVVFESGSTATALTITPPTGQTVKWANGFDPTALEANTTYEINICDGLGVAASWT